jgi:hypothetical protein
MLRRYPRASGRKPRFAKLSDRVSIRRSFGKNDANDWRMEMAEGRKGMGLTLGGVIVIVGIVLAIVWSIVIGIIVALIGLVAFGGFVRGKWY